ncbi:unnamed protein product [Mytilus edulis]|uniref:Envelope fusion protein n=1 Tax=Mytilus edulis TaxID=6550 RepID=A0A8S3PS10_MYTED|nr:unnamed protein product [Mytilus edulis]
MMGLIVNKYQILVLQQEMTNISSAFQRVFANYTQIMTLEGEEIRGMENYINDVRVGLTNLAEGKLSPFILPPESLSSTIDKIQTMLQTNFKGYKLLSTDPSYYYRYGKFLVYRNSTTIYISLKFPVTTLNKQFHVWKVLSFMVPINETSNHASILKDIPDYLLVTKDNKFYTKLSKFTIQQCERTTNIRHCNAKPTFHNIDEETSECIIDIFLNNKEGIKENCNFRFLENNIHPHILQIAPNKILVYKIYNFTLDCNAGSYVRPGCDFCIVSIPCHCAIITSTTHFPAHVYDCETNSTETTKLHLVNLALLQEFFNSTKLIDILGNTTFDDPVSVNFPNFEIYKHKFQHIIATDKKEDMSLKKMAKRAKERSKIYTHLADSLVDGEVDFPESWLTKRDILSLSAIVIASLNAIATIYLIYKFKIIAAAISVYSPVKADSFNYEFPTTQDTLNNEWTKVLSDNIK